MHYTLQDIIKPTSFIMIPKALYQSAYRELSNDAKTLYAWMLDRVSLSIKNHKVDKEGRVYIIFTQTEAAELFSFGGQKIQKMYKELEQFQLIERKKQGHNLPDLIFVQKLELCEPEQPCVIKTSSVEPSIERHEWTGENHQSGGVKITSPEPLKSSVRASDFHQSGEVKIITNQDLENHTEYNHTESIYLAKDDFNEKERDGEMTNQEAVVVVKKQIDYDAIEGEPQFLQAIVHTMAEVYSTCKNFNINGQLMNALDLREPYRNLNQMHIEYVLECIAKRSGAARPIRNLRSYVASCLYSAAETMEVYYAEQRRGNLGQKFKPEGRDLEYLVR